MEKFHFKDQFTQKYKFIHENRSGIIDKSDNIYGGGAYDGAFSTDLIRNQMEFIELFFYQTCILTQRKFLLLA